MESSYGSLKWVKKQPFLGLHVAYFLVLSLAGAVSLWAAPKAEPLPFIDALFNAVSAITETGLGSVPIHRFSLSDQIALLLLMLVGGQVFTSAIPLFLQSRLLSRNEDEPNTPNRSNFGNHKNPHLVQKENGALHTSLPMPHTTEDHIQRNSMEYKALVTMSWVTACHYVFSITAGFLICQICLVCSPHASAVLKKNQVSSSLFSIFATASAFGNCGYILLDENLEPLQRSWVMILCLATLLLIGNTLYAPALRLWVWVLYRRATGERKSVYEHILGSREKRFTHMFSREETGWLTGSVLFLNACQVMCMLGLDWSGEALKGLGAGYKLVVALFQSINTRTGGMNVVSLSSLSSPTLFIFLVAMYIASYPIFDLAKQRRRTPKKNIFVAQIYNLRAKDSFIFMAIFFICFLEREPLKNDPLNFSLFNIVFEVISGFGNVGLSIGYRCSLKTSTSECRDIPCAFSGRWSVGGKVVLIITMLLGRHQSFLQDLDWNFTYPSNTLSRHFDA